MKSDIEAKAQVEPLDELLARRDCVVEDLAPLYAKFGPFGTAEAELSAEVARVNGLLRAMAAVEGKKTSEEALKMGARCHPDVIGMIAQHTTGRSRYFRLNAEMQDIEFRVSRGQAVLRCYAAELRT